MTPLIYFCHSQRSEAPAGMTRFRSALKSIIGRSRRRAAGCHHLVVADDVALAFNHQPDLGILVGADVLDHMPLRGGVGGSVIESDAAIKPAHRAVPDGDVLALVGVDADGHCTQPRAQAPDFETVQVQYDIVGIDGDGVARGDAGAEVAGEAIHALGGDRVGERGDGGAIDRLGLHEV